MTLPYCVYLIYRWCSVILFLPTGIQLGWWLQYVDGVNTLPQYWLAIFLPLRLFISVAHGTFSIAILLPATYSSCGADMTMYAFHNKQDRFYDHVHLCTVAIVAWVILSYITVGMLWWDLQPAVLWVLECIHLAYWTYIATLRIIALRRGTTRQWFTLQWNVGELPPPVLASPALPESFQSPVLTHVSGV